MNSFTNWLDLSKAYTEPINKNLLNTLSGLSFRMAKGRSNIRATITWTSKRDAKLFNHPLNIPYVLLFIRHKIANGESKMRTFVIMYLKAKVMIKENEDIDNIPFKIPSNENKLNWLFEGPLNFIIRLEKEILVPNIFLPKSNMNSVTSYVKFNTLVQIVSENMVRIASTTAFTKNWYGFSTEVPL